MPNPNELDEEKYYKDMRRELLDYVQEQTLQSGETKLRITKRKIDAVLRNASFRPSDPGPMHVIMDIGNADYFVKRAEEYLISASESPTSSQRDSHLQMALRLTALAILYYDEST